MQRGNGTRTLGILGSVATLLGAYILIVRPWHLRWGVTDAEFGKSYPGDELLPGVSSHVTHAITIAATPEKIWPWLMQIGQDRGGFYSYTPLENLAGCEMPRVDRLISEWHDRVVGEKVWLATPKHFEGKAYMQTAVLESNRAFVLFAGDDLAAKQAATWGFFLEPVGPQTTRLVARGRAAQPSGLGSHVLAYVFWEPAHFVMERKMLLTIKRLAEGNS